MYCVFVVWREDKLNIERITVDSRGVLLELLGKYLTKQPIASSLVTIDDKSDSNKSDSDESNDKWCYCHLGDVDDMIGCDNERSLIQWFHYSYLVNCYTNS